MPENVFSDEFCLEFRRLLFWRRDVRRFLATPLPDGILEELIDLARLAPSVGLSEPWRFIKVKTPGLRAKVREDFRHANADALAGYSGEQANAYSRLKLEGLAQAPVHVAVFADCTTRKGAGLGRGTMPETLEYSVVSAITTLWLAARAYGIGMGWVSILNPKQIGSILSVPDEWQFVAYLCLGYPEAESDTPELERAGWEKRAGSKCDALLER